MIKIEKKFLVNEIIMKIELSTIDSEFETENKFVFKIVHAMQMIKSFKYSFSSISNKSIVWSSI